MSDESAASETDDPSRFKGATFTQNILVSTDFSRASELAMDAAAILARQNLARITLVHVIDPKDVIDEADLHKKLRKLRFRKFNEIEAAKTALVRSRSPADGICHYAEKENVDLIVIATRGHTGLKKMMIGSVAEAVVRHAPCPVLTLRSRA